MLVGENLVNRRSPEVAVDEIGVGGAVELVDGFDAVVGEEIISSGGCSRSVRVCMAAGPAVEDVVVFIDGFGDCAAGRFAGYVREAGAGVPGVLLVGTCRDLCFSGVVSFVVLGVVLVCVGGGRVLGCGV